jgi:hypothetical protein
MAGGANISCATPLHVYAGQPGFEGGMKQILCGLGVAHPNRWLLLFSLVTVCAVVGCSCDIGGCLSKISVRCSRAVGCLDGGTLRSFPGLRVAEPGGVVALLRRRVRPGRTSVRGHRVEHELVGSSGQVVGGGAAL